MNISKLKSILCALVVCTSFLGLSGCSSWKSYIPTELKSSGSMKKIYEVDGSHWVGPSGINEAFVVYSVPDKVLQRIQSEGLGYLKNLDSTAESLYKGWQATPIQLNEERWNRQRNDAYNTLVRKGLSAEQRWVRYRTKYGKRDTKLRDTSLGSFYGDYKSLPHYFQNTETLRKRSLTDVNFVDDINPEYVDLVDSILNSPNSYFGYGESGALVLSLEHKKLFLLFRD
ncbi:hypothetical protein OAI07_00735 [Akkermansiaceae bacterium]|nr:hypothetical protein [Akkermansiaceae bacterium]